MCLGTSTPLLGADRSARAAGSRWGRSYAAAAAGAVSVMSILGSTHSALTWQHASQVRAFCRTLEQEQSLKILVTVLDENNRNIYLYIIYLSDILRIGRIGIILSNNNDSIEHISKYLWAAMTWRHIFAAPGAGREGDWVHCRAATVNGTFDEQNWQMARLRRGAVTWCDAKLGRIIDIKKPICWL